MRSILLSLLALSTALSGAGVGVIPKSSKLEQTIGALPVRQKAETVAQNDPSPENKQKPKIVNSLRNGSNQNFKQTPKAPTAQCAAPCPTPCEQVCYEPCDPPKASRRNLFWVPVAIVAGGVAAACVSAIHSGSDDVGPSGSDPTPPPPVPDNLQFNIVMTVGSTGGPVDYTIDLTGPSGPIQTDPNIPFENVGDNHLIPGSVIVDPETGNYTIQVSYEMDFPAVTFDGEMLVNGIVVDSGPMILVADSFYTITFTYPAP